MYVYIYVCLPLSFSLFPNLVTSSAARMVAHTNRRRKERGGKKKSKGDGENEREKERTKLREKEKDGGGEEKGSRRAKERERKMAGDIHIYRHTLYEHTSH